MARPSKKVTLKGWAITSTEHAVLWHDKATGYELWFALSTVTESGKTLTVPEWMYVQKLQEYERGLRRNEVENKRAEARDKRDLEREGRELEQALAEAGLKPRGRKKRSGCGCLLLIVIVAAIVAAVILTKATQR